jgi:hypothetical protein
MGKQLLEEDAHLESGEMHAQARVSAVAKGDMRIGLPIDLKTGVGE